MRRALVVGRASGVWDDYARASALGTFDDVLVVGQVGAIFPGHINHWVSFHYQLFEIWANQRATNKLPPADNYWTSEFRPRREPLSRCGKVVREVACEGGSSGLVAVMVALKKLDADRVVLAGVPMEAAAGRVCRTAKEAFEWDEADKYWAAWGEHAVLLGAHVRSMSGRTREVFGEATQEWFDGVEGQ